MVELDDKYFDVASSRINAYLNNKAECIGRDILNKLNDAQSMLNNLVDYLDDVDSDYT